MLVISNIHLFILLSVKHLSGKTYIQPFFPF